MGVCAIAAALVLSPAASAQQGVLKTPAAPETVKSSRSKHKTAARDARHFRELSSRLPPVAFTAVAVDPADPEVILVGSDGFVFKSDDGGDVWRPVFSFARGLPQANLLLPLVDLNGDEVNDAVTDEVMGIGITGGILPDADELGSGGTDRSASDPLNETGDSFSDNAEEDDDPDDLVAVLPDGDAAGLDVFDATGAAAVLYPRQRPGVRSLVFASSTQATVFAATPRGLFQSTDAGESFQPMFLPLPEGDEHTLEKVIDVRDVGVHPKTPNVLWVGTGGGLLYSTNGGGSFSWVKGKLGVTGILDLQVVIENRRAVVLVGTEEGAFRSTDDGKTFQQMMLQGASAFEPVLSVAYDVRERITYAGSAHGLYVSERGASILERRPNLSATLVTSMSIDPKRLGGLVVGLQDRGPLFLEDRGFRVLQDQQSLPVAWTSGMARIPGDTDTIVLSTDKGIFIHEKGKGLLMLTDNMQKLRRRWSREPSLREIVELALEVEHLHPRVVRGMFSRVRLAPLLPSVTFVYLARYDTRPTALVEDEEDLEDLIEDAEEGDLGAFKSGWKHRAYLMAIWTPERLITSTAEQQILRLLPRLSKKRERLVSLIVRTYHTRRRLLAEVFGAQPNPELLAHQLVKLAELTSVLDAYTNGSFSRLAAERGAPVDNLEDQALDSAAAQASAEHPTPRQLRLARTNP